jgi:hypothetical protein
MTELPPDVRDRAATAARAAWLNASAPVAETWPDVVDAVAEQVGCGHLDGPYRKVLAERDALKARVDLLTAALTDAVAQIGWLACADEHGEWARDKIQANARAVLSATPTESETP